MGRPSEPKVKPEPMSRFSRLRRRRYHRHKARRFITKVLAWVLFAVVYYIVYSTLFDTHFEQVAEGYVKELDSQYNTLLGRYETLEAILENVKERDGAIFVNIFDAPISEDQLTHDNRSIDLYEAIVAMPTSSITAELYARLSRLDDKIGSLEQGYKEMILKVDSVGVQGRNIPSIQPIVNNTLTKLTASYGPSMHPFYRTVRLHEGVDYSVPEGTRVFATADGVVESVSNLNSTAGKTVVIDHGNGYKTAYKHLSSIVVPRGRSVKRGDIIALTGNSGLSLSPHLHYEISFNGASVDPLHYFFMELTPEEYWQIGHIASSRRQSFD